MSTTMHLPSRVLALEKKKNSLNLLGKKKWGAVDEDRIWPEHFKCLFTTNISSLENQ